MRQLPATTNSNSGASNTPENSRPRSQDFSHTTVLTNGIVKDPILTRSKSKLRGGRRLLDRRLSTSLKNHHEANHNSSSRRKQKNASNTSTPPKNNSGAITSTTSFTSTSSPPVEKMYARHYKSYRGLNGVKSRRGESSSSSTAGNSNDASHSPPIKKKSPSSSSRNESGSGSGGSGSRSLSSPGKECRSVSSRLQNGSTKRPSSALSSSSSSSTDLRRNGSQRIRRLMQKRKSQRQQRRCQRQETSISTSRNKRRNNNNNSEKEEEEEEDEKEEESEEEEEDDKCNNTCSSATATKEDKGKGEHQNKIFTTTNNNCSRVMKRRSALWVLNCEAESFLFGETAAEKHEVELPPLTPPSPSPKKRRWRVNELGALLEKSPGVIESKLRKPHPPSESCGDGDTTPCDGSPQRKRLKHNAHHQRNAAVRRTNAEKKKSSEKTTTTATTMCSSKSRCTDQQIKQEQVKRKTTTTTTTTTTTSVGEKEEKVEDALVIPKTELLSPIPFLYSPDSVDYEAKTVQFHQMLSGLDFGYSFERPPNKDEWYRALERPTDDIVPYTYFQSPLSQSVLLPYEIDRQIRRSRSKPVRNSRKSPRCHASTLAILSSRSTRSSVTLDGSPSPTSSSSVINPSSSSLVEASLSTSPKTVQIRASSPSSSLSQPSLSLLSQSTVAVTGAGTSTTAPPTPSSSSRLLSPPKYTPYFRRRHLSSHSASSSSKPNQMCSKEELGASQYLWDSIQFLSDPYVVTILAGDIPDTKRRRRHSPRCAENNTKAKTKCNHDHHHHQNSNNNYFYNNNNNCPVKRLVRHLQTSSSSERKASLRSNDGTTLGNLPNNMTTPVPKSSPRNHHQSHSHNQSTNSVTVTVDCNDVPSPPLSPNGNDNSSGVMRRMKSRSPHSNMVHPHPSSTSKRNKAHVPNNVNRFTLNNSKGSAAAIASDSTTKSSNCNGLTDSDTSNTNTNPCSRGSNGLIVHEKNCKKSPVVLVSDIFTSKSKIDSWDEELLFNGDGLPPLPFWPLS